MGSARIEETLRSWKWEEAEAVEVPSVVRSRIEETLQTLPSRRSLRRHIRVRRAVLTAAVSIGLFGMAGLSVATWGGQASDWLRPLFGATATSGILSAKPQEPLASVTDQGIEFQVTKVEYDGLKLDIHYMIRKGQSEDLKSQFEHWPLVSTTEYALPSLEADILVDGVHVDSIEPSAITYPIQEVRGEGQKSTYEGAIYTSLHNYRPPSFQLSLHVMRIGEQTGNWEVKMPVQMVYMAEQFKKLDVKKSGPQGTLAFTGIRANEQTTQIQYSFQSTSEFTRRLELIDDHGKWVPIYFDEGHLLRLPSLPASTKYLTVRVKKVEVDGEVAKDLNEEVKTPLAEKPTPEHPLKLPQGAAGYVLITGIDFLKDKTVFHYRTVGSNPVQQTSWNLLDENGKMLLALEPYDLTVEKADRTAVYPPLSPDAKLTFVTRKTVALTELQAFKTRIDIPR